ncbi:hypothetical protein E5676_scaffold522G00990 [Cucumis melo var. makuwa]|nr:hypothetical protein E5676_scaffold522G00990 [Cucumis melo var. makuwa]
MCASLGSTRLICAFYGTTRLLCRVGAQRGADRREAGRMREGHMDASGFLIASAMYFGKYMVWIGEIVYVIGKVEGKDITLAAKGSKRRKVRFSAK